METPAERRLRLKEHKLKVAGNKAAKKRYRKEMASRKKAKRKELAAAKKAQRKQLADAKKKHAAEKKYHAKELAALARKSRAVRIAQRVGLLGR